MNTVKILDKEFVQSIPAENIHERIGEMAQVLNSEYWDKDPVLIVILKGSFIFASDLIRAVGFDSEIEFVRISSYHGGTASTGKVRELLGLEKSLEGRHVLVIEDIVDTGLTVQWIRDYLGQMNPASLKIATLLFKEEPYQLELPPEFVCFRIPNEFVVGYGLDYGEKGRSLNSIYKLK